MFMQERQHRIELPKLDRIDLRAKRNLIAEQGRSVARIGGTTCEAQQGDVIDVGQCGLVTLEGIAEPERKQARPERSLHRVTCPQVGSNGKCGDELGQT
jgi:hypothetical protein